MHSIGEAIKKVRTERKLSQEEFANRINKKMDMSITKGMISKWEKDLTEPKANVLRAIVTTFGVSMDELLGVGEFADKSHYRVIAAHIDDDVTEDELEDIMDYIEYIKNKRK
ncbi:helix-turn-helix domain-containing protein [Jeotgalibacillus terrae]|uniref:Helix-turn-helix domain-containing protein n=1 Tax=Jeotgalibacillus terrae TaxID=587735 RepID=A0ABW5ZFJ7_9BACL|nr:helix-turn-helix transcriptional regulator [Jeotgalibacillus terrae]MBM7577705.1 transcriptional regulator with XRE-family HTH domain [Jeotgalibacillus terrae]